MNRATTQREKITLHVETFKFRSKQLREEINLRISLQNRNSTEYLVGLTGLFIGGIWFLIKSDIKFIPLLTVGYGYLLILIYANYIYQTYLIFKLAIKDREINYYIGKKLRLKPITLLTWEKEPIYTYSRLIKFLLESLQVIPLLGMTLLSIVFSFLYQKLTPNISKAMSKEIQYCQMINLFRYLLLLISIVLTFIHFWVIKNYNPARFFNEK